MSNRRPIVDLRNLGVRYDDVVALEHVNLTIYDNDFIGVIGPNGGGKSSLVKAIMGIVPYSGVIEYDDSILRHKKPHIGYMPQITSFDKAFPISVSEVVMSGLQAERGLFKSFGSIERKRVDEVLERAHLLELRKRAIGELSGGQLQRVMLCRAIISATVWRSLVSRGPRLRKWLAVIPALTAAPQSRTSAPAAGPSFRRKGSRRAEKSILSRRQVQKCSSAFPKGPSSLSFQLALFSNLFFSYVDDGSLQRMTALIQILLFSFVMKEPVI